MSTQRELPIKCPSCSYVSTKLISISVNAGRSPHLRKALIDQEFHRFRCEKCYKWYTVDVDMNWIDFDRKQWIRIYPLQSIGQWENKAKETVESFQYNLAGDTAPKMAREMAEGMIVRTVFGPGALREKIIIWDAGLDDRVIVLCQWALFQERRTLDLSEMPRLLSCSDSKVCFYNENNGMTWELPFEFYQTYETFLEKNKDMQKMLSGPWVDPLQLFYNQETEDI